jgi:hypothetical protein
MRRSPHAAASSAAQSTLLALAGWAPSRRSFLGSALMIAGASAATTTAALPVASRAVQAGLPLPTGVSPRMTSLISDFMRLSAALSATDHAADPAAWDRAAAARGPALDALVFERPISLMDFAAKMTAMVEFMAEEDSELFTLRRLAEDATLLAGSAK